MASMVPIQLIHPVTVTLIIDRNQNPMPVNLPAQVTWTRHGETGLYQNVCEEQFAGSLTFQAETVAGYIESGTLEGTRITAIAGSDYTAAGLTIRHIVPLAHQGGLPRLIKAFFAAEIFPAGGETAAAMVSCSDAPA